MRIPLAAFFSDIILLSGRRTESFVHQNDGRLNARGRMCKRAYLEKVDEIVPVAALKQQKPVLWHFAIHRLLFVLWEECAQITPRDDPA